MTELFIDGVSVVLPKDINIPVKHENPFFTKNGEYTYDIDLDLTNPINTRLYEHLNRINSITELKDKRRAVLVADHRVYCDGTEVITGWNEKKVSVQIASGNSELNYFLGSDLLIESLDMGSAVLPPLGDDITDFLNKNYPEVEFNIPPTLIGDTMVNPLERVVVFSGRREGGTKVSHRPIPGSIYIPMPYMGGVMEKVIQSIGYTIVENQFISTPWKRQIIIHGQQTNEYAKMFPGWTVKDFLEEVEKLYGIIFLINSRKKEVRILLSSNYYLNPSIAYLTSVVDAYTEETEDNEGDVNLGIRNIRYELPDNEYYKKRRLPDTLVQMAVKKEIQGVPKFTSESNGMELITNTITGVQYIKTSFETKEHSGAIRTLYRGCPVNEYADLIRNSGEEDFVTLKMIPVQHGAVQVKQIYTDTEKGTTTISYLQRIVPVLDNDSNLSLSDDDDTEPSPSQQGIEDFIKNNNYEKDTAKSTIFLGFYTGIKNQVGYAHRPSAEPFPTVYTDDILNKGFIFYANETTSPKVDARMIEEGESMSLKVIAEALYKENYDIKRDNKFIFHCYDPNLYDIRSVFVINNKRFVCKEFTFTIDIHGRKGAWEGSFYPITISDTEALSRWILTDGKWRDGGVWLDNGRWLDE